MIIFKYEIFQVLSRERSQALNHKFLINVLTDDDCPEVNGFNTAIARTNGQQLQAKTNMQYIPLIDMTPHDPDTIMTSLTQAQEITTSNLGDQSLSPICMPAGVPLAPEWVLKLIRCNCKSSTVQCGTRRCKCKSGNICCTIFCACKNDKCCNVQNNSG